MAPEDSNRQSSSTASQPTAGNIPVHRTLDHSHPPSNRPRQIPTASPAVVRCLTSDLQLTQAILYSDKVVLAFEEEFSSAQVQDWIRTFNIDSAFYLTVFEELPNALFVGQFAMADLHTAKNRLLAASPLRAGNVYAAVNDYTITLNPCSQVDFKHLVTVNILQGSPALFRIIQFLTAGIPR